MSDFQGEFWLVAVPKEKKTPEQVYAAQRAKLSRMCKVNPFDMPGLRISAVDELLNLNDKLMKYDVFSRSVVQRLVRSYREYIGQEDALPTVHDRQLYRYVPSFEWEKGKFSTQSKLPQLVEDVHDRLVTTHDRLKQMEDRYKQIKTRLTAGERASEGNLMICDLQKFVKPADYIEGEYITTAMVVVPTQKMQHFEENYYRLEQTEEATELWRREMTKKQKLKESALKGNEELEEEVGEKINWKERAMPAEYRETLEIVAPGSAQLLEKQNDFCLYRVVLLKKGVSWFKSIGREFRYNVRDFEYKDEKSKAEDKMTVEKLEKEESDKKKRLIMFCNHSFPDALEQWLHLKMTRVFVEAVLRYGPGEALSCENFVTSILEVKTNMGGPLSNVLGSMYKHLESQDMQADDADSGIMGAGDMKSYVFVPLMCNFD